MLRDYEKMFGKLEQPEPGDDLFNKIILSIRREERLRRAKKSFFIFVAMLSISLAAVPFSGLMLINQVRNSDIYYFVVSALSDFGIFVSSWQNFAWAILESLPILQLTAFISSIMLALFTIRLFLREKQLFFGYLRQSLA